MVVVKIDDLKTTEGKLDFISYKVKENNDLIRSLIRQRKSNKTGIIQDLVVERGRITTTEVMNHLNCCRAWALEIIKKIGRELDFKFIGGESSRNRPSVLIYTKSNQREKQIEMIKSKLEEINTLTLNAIMKTLCVDIQNARIIAVDISSQYPDKFKLEENKLRKVE